LIEQAKYFSMTVPQAIEVGRAATAFTREKLSEPFTVFTHMSDAMGQSRLERFYAFVQTKDGDLGEQLVRSGLARIYGFKAAPPGSRNLRAEIEKLQQFENQARQEEIGAWGINAGRSPAPESSPAIHFSTPKPGASKPSVGTPKSNRSHPKEKTPLGRIDINTATEKELTTVPGIGHVMAARIIAARPFKSADDLKKVSGIGDKKYEEMRPYFQ
jgi:competence ComEA-like helix-hairpin-helix protein